MHKSSTHIHANKAQVPLHVRTAVYTCLLSRKQNACDCVGNGVSVYLCMYVRELVQELKRIRFIIVLQRTQLAQQKTEFASARRLDSV
jgi:hypothetical protein